jgi:putative ATP-dependent endonuclease of OLD family
MKLLNLGIKNYRNLDGLSLSFHPQTNFIIGENNVGKSNFLDLLNILFNKSSFEEDDFCDCSRHIEVFLTLGVSEIEIGIFNDLFDPTSNALINIVAVQESVDETIKFKHKESETPIQSSIVKCVNYINYDSLRNPISELNFTKNRGVGKILNHIIIKTLEKSETKDKDISFLKNEKIDEFLVPINQTIQRIKSFKDFSIQAIKESNPEDLLSKLILLVDDKEQSLSKLGYGVQFFSLITLSILEKVLNLVQRRINKSLVQDISTGEECIPILIGLDEPEIHLNPYIQRALVRYLEKIINNEDQDFKALLKELFLIDRLIGQILIISHSPSILLNSYKQFIRFYKDENGKVGIKSGYEISLDSSIEKQLLKNLPYVKEAFFSRVVILVEGDELGALHVFSERMGVNLDELGISIIQAGGIKSIPILINLLDEFAIKNLGLMDIDNNNNVIYAHIKNLFFTQGKDFEEDICDSFNVKDFIRYLEDESKNENISNFIFGPAKKINIEFDPYQPIIPQLDILEETQLQKLHTELKVKILSKLRGSKNILNAQALARYVTVIPQTYKDIIKTAVEFSKNAS